MAPFPLIKLAIVFFKQVSKPLANQIKIRAKNSEFFKTQICVPAAQFYHWYDVNYRMKTLGIETNKVAKMNEEAAVALGADILGELVIMSVAIAGVTVEYIRSARAAREKENQQLDRLTNIETRISDLKTASDNQAAHLSELEQLLRTHSHGRSPFGISFGQLQPMNLLLPMIHAIHQTNHNILSSVKHWLSSS